MIRIGINGFGRIGRQVLKIIMDKYSDKMEVAAINDLMDTATNAHLFKYDSNYGTYEGKVTVEKDRFLIDGKIIKNFAVRDPAQIPWKDEGVSIVVESTGLFTEGPKAEAHLKAGAKKVIITTPAKKEDITIVMGVNHQKYDPAKHNIISNASCTTNCLAPPAMVVNNAFGIERGLMVTVHAYTNDQRILDQPHKDLRRARAAAMSIIPTTTGAARALSLVIPELAGKFDGYAMRVPTPTVSVVDFSAELKKETDTETLCKALRQASQNELKGIMACETEQLVSIDFKGNPHSSIVDMPLVQVLNGKLAKIVSWYDNECGYSNRVADLCNYIGSKM